MEKVTFGEFLFLLGILGALAFLVALALMKLQAERRKKARS